MKSSSVWIWRLIAEGVTPSSAAACVELPCRDENWKAHRAALSGARASRNAASDEAISTGDEFFELAVTRPSYYAIWGCCSQLSCSTRRPRQKSKSDEQISRKRELSAPQTHGPLPSKIKGSYDLSSPGSRQGSACPIRRGCLPQSVYVGQGHGSNG